jgi:hypothetical protein
MEGRTEGRKEGRKLVYDFAVKWYYLSNCFMPGPIVRISMFYIFSFSFSFYPLG